MKKVECFSDPTICKDPVCKLTAVARNLQVATYGCTPVKPITTLFVSILPIQIRLNILKYYLLHTHPRTLPKDTAVTMEENEFE
jgi:hypothetical protein